LNVGDSGLHIIRQGASVFETPEQQHYFNCPYQLGMGSDDTPGDGDYYILENLRNDDLLVLATDGVWDNVFDDELIQAIEEETNNGGSTESMARTISKISHLHGRDVKYDSPFALNALKQGLRYTGGKLDDVTVIVARVLKTETQGEVYPELKQRKLTKLKKLSSPVSSAESSGE